MPIKTSKKGAKVFNPVKDLSIKELKGFLYNPRRKPASIEEMDEAVGRFLAEENAPPSDRSKKR
jgi:hypothetical protein